ncbi:ABC transporter ATP-binding protein [Enterococcus hirae]|nr:ABC transporter ATP-binding protein [Enterococcus hirae]
MENIVIEFKNFSYQYPSAEALNLNDLSFTIQKGEFIGIIGKNGSGKTTLLNAIRGFVPHFFKGKSSGTALVTGRNIATPAEANEIAPKIGFVFQNPFNQLSGIEKTVYHEIAFGLENAGIAPAFMRQKIDQILEELDLTAIKDKNPFALSGGQLQKVALASVLVMDPAILLIDEPSSQLDPQARAEIFQIFQRLKKTGKTLIVIDHDLEKLSQLATRLFVLEDGCLAAAGTPEEILRTNIAEKYGFSLPQRIELADFLQKHFPLDSLSAEIANVLDDS